MKVLDIQNEIRVIASGVLDAKCLWKLLDTAKESDFFSSYGKYLYSCIVELYELQGSVGIESIRYAVERKDVKDPELLKVIASLPLLADIYNFDLMLEDLIDQSVIRKIQEGLKRDFQSIEKLPDSKRKEFIDDYKTHVLQVVFSEKDADGIDVAEVCEKDLIHEEALKNHQDFLDGLKSTSYQETGFKDLDRLIKGFHPGHLVVIGARPGCGKSTFMLNLASNQEIKSMVFSLEMTKDEVFKKMMLKECCIDYNDFISGKLTNNDLEKIRQMSSVFSTKNIYIDDRAGIRPSDLYRRAHHRKISKGLQVVYIDYLQLMASDERYENNQARVTTISRALKKIAKDLGITVVALAQLNRELENRENKIPRNSDLRESGAIEADADVIILLSHEKETTPYLLDAYVTKNRFGSLGKFNLLWDLKTGKMQDLVKTPLEY